MPEDFASLIRAPASAPYEQDAEAKRLWRLLDSGAMETRVASDWHSDAEVFTLLDVNAYFRLTRQLPPELPHEQLATLAKEGLIVARDSGQWGITTLGALMFAQDLLQFGELSSRAVRIVRYFGTRRTAETQRQIVTSGYADFEQIFTTLSTLVPATETIQGALRRDELAFPSLALRELLANSLIHQDLAVYGAGPRVEVFDDRIEFTNPGTSLIADERLVNDPPRARNRMLAALARRIGICEEAGSGWDKIVDSIEERFLPAPQITRVDSAESPSMRIMLRRFLPFRNLSTDERVDAAYWHACAQYANNEVLTNASLRIRFGLESTPGATSQVSRVIRDAVAAGRIRQRDPQAPRKSMSYIPAWA